jgi:putative oxidoreductase
MANQPVNSSSPAMFAATDRYASGWADAILLIARILIGWLMFTNGWAKLMNITPFVGYLTSLKVPAASFWAWPATAAEVVLGAALILGLATRYASLATFVYLGITIALAHRYWEFPAGQPQATQYANFLKNLAIMGGTLLLYVTGAGRFSVDAWLRRR